jgi:hypothetical protein
MVYKDTWRKEFAFSPPGSVGGGLVLTKNASRSNGVQASGEPRAPHHFQNFP